MDALYKAIVEALAQRGQKERDRREEWNRSLKPTQYLGNNLFQEMGGQPLEGRYLGKRSLIPGQFVPNIGRNPNKPVIPGLPNPVQTIDEEPPIAKSFTQTDTIPDADFYVFSYTFSDGRDLDTRTILRDPLVSTEPLGWARLGSIGSPAFLTWGGDNTGLGVEAVLFEKDKFRQSFARNSLTISFGCFWYGSVGTSPIVVEARGFKGGVMQKSGFTWTNPTATKTFVIQSISKQVTLFNQNSASNGEEIGTIVVELT